MRRLYSLAESMTLSGRALSMSITTTCQKLMSQVGHKTQDTFEYAIWHDSLPGSTSGVLALRAAGVDSGEAGDAEAEYAIPVQGDQASTAGTGRDTPWAQDFCRALQAMEYIPIDHWPWEEEDCVGEASYQAAFRSLKNI